MATLVKNFKVKSGLVVEGSTGTIGGYDILTKKAADQSYIIGLIGGSATAENTPNKVVLRDEDGSFAAEVITADGGFVGNVTGDVTGDLTGNADTATALETARTIQLTGDVTGSVSFDGTGNVQISTTVDGSFATDSEVATAKEEAIDAAELYTDGRETAITTAYQNYADQAELDAVATAALDATSKANTAEDNAIAAAALDATAKANAAEDAAIAYTNTALEDYTTTANLDTTIDGYGYLKSADLGDYATQTYVNDAVDALVDGAPGLLDTLNEIAAAINDDQNYATTMTTALAGKQNNLTAGDNISIVGDTISVTGLDTADVAEDASRLYFTDARAVTANTGLWDTIGDAAAAQSAAETFATNADTTLYGTVTGDIATAKSEAGVIAQGYADTAEQNANDYAEGLVEDLQDIVNGLTTDDVAEGSNQYYLPSRAKTDAAALLVGAIKTNIEIAGDENGLTITAENGVADSTTNDLAEGTGPNPNLYFTDERAVDALQGTDSMFTTVDINEVALQVAAQTDEIATAGVQTAYAWAKADYRSAEFLVKVAYGTHTEISKVLLTLDTVDNIAITEYGIVGTNGSASTISAAIVDDEVELQVTTANNNSTITVVGTLLA